MVNKKQKIADRGKVDVSKLDNSLAKHMTKIQKLRKKGRVESSKIQVKMNVDHYNVSLWTKDGKRIGPLHPHNAVRTLERFQELGVELEVDQPTQDQIEAYKQTDEYKQKMEEHLRKREIKEQSRGKKQMDRICNEIAKMSGQTVEAITNIVKPAMTKKDVGVKDEK